MRSPGSPKQGGVRTFLPVTVFARTRRRHDGTGLLCLFDTSEIDSWLTENEQAERSSPRRHARDPLDLAQEWQRLLENGTCKSRAEVARQLGISRARVTQVLQRVDTLQVEKT